MAFPSSYTSSREPSSHPSLSSAFVWSIKTSLAAAVQIRCNLQFLWNRLEHRDAEFVKRSEMYIQRAELISLLETRLYMMRDNLEVANAKHDLLRVNNASYVGERDCQRLKVSGLHRITKLDLHAQFSYVSAAVRTKAIRE